MATIDKDLLLDKIDRLLKLHNYAREDWFANVIHNTVWDAPEIETDGDTIYRADAIEAIQNAYCKPCKERGNDYNEVRCRACEYDDAIVQIDALPSADADRPKVVGIDYSPYRVQTTAPSAEAVSVEDEKQIENLILFKEYLRGRRDAVQGWIPCSERLPKVNQRVLLATNDGRVFVGYREKPDLVWQVTEKDGRKHWVYDPENYTDDIEILPKNEDCGFSKDDVYSDGFLSVASVNYDDRFVGVTAWMPLPKPYTKGDNDEER